MNLLLGAALLGWVGGMIWARTAHRPYQVPDLRWAWLVPLAFVPQFFAFVLPATRTAIPTAWIPVALVGSQALLLLFAIINIRQIGFWLLAGGLVLNLAVILLNGGMMPISPDTLQQSVSQCPGRGLAVRTAFWGRQGCGSTGCRNRPYGFYQTVWCYHNGFHIKSPSAWEMS